MRNRFLGALLASVFLGASAQAATLTSFTFDSIFIPSIDVSTLTPLPVIGSGDITLDALGNVLSADLFLPVHTLELFALIPGPLLLGTVVTTGWNQTNTLGAATAGGATAAFVTTGSGLQACTPAAFPTICDNVSPGVGSWPSTFIDNEESAVITITSFISPTQFAGTIVQETFNPAGGTAVRTYSFSVPEPGTALLIGSGLLGLTVVGRRRK